MFLRAARTRRQVLDTIHMQPSAAIAGRQYPIPFFERFHAGDHLGAVGPIILERPYFFEDAGRAGGGLRHREGVHGDGIAIGGGGGMPGGFAGPVGLRAVWCLGVVVSVVILCAVAAGMYISVQRTS
jgi:hypothetical protein